ncbi:glycosyltransferase family 4 protein [Francisella sp. Scap27]|uniref:glycosyltransferase n=1 Tax=Francisella sp. Scap27 TaxID=2589986 RepID=UPI0015BE58C1|nr:glycosyltransferase [Francisella sp. Scap27]QLE78512.1 glycosyltransferase family 4 protein [Francisella sp. Scap27]
MHILVLPSWYPLYEGDFSGSFFKEQTIAYKSYFPNAKVGVIYQHFYSLKKVGFKLDINDIDNGVLTIIKTSVSIPKLRQLQAKIHIYKTIKLFKKYIKQNGKPDLIHVHSAWQSGLVALQIYEKYNIPYILTEHSTAFQREMFSQKQLDIISNVFKYSSKNIAVSNAFAKYLSIFFKRKFEYIPNSVNSKFLEKRNTNNNNNSFDFISIAGLDFKKGFDVLIESFSRAFNNIDDVRLIVGGDGVEKNKLQELSKDLKIADKVVFLGKLSRKETLNRMQNSDAFVLASRYETFGVVFVEALACELPIIATRCGGPESIVNEDVGYLVEKNNVEELANAMLDLYNHKQQWSSKKESIKKYCKNNFSQKVVANKYYQVYKSVLER